MSTWNLFLICIRVGDKGIPLIRLAFSVKKILTSLMSKHNNSDKKSELHSNIFSELPTTKNRSMCMGIRSYNRSLWWIFCNLIYFFNCCGKYWWFVVIILNEQKHLYKGCDQIFNARCSEIQTNTENKSFYISRVHTSNTEIRKKNENTFYLPWY